MNLVITIMTKEILEQNQIDNVTKILCDFFNAHAKIFIFNNHDSQYYETDIDLYDINFSQAECMKEIDSLIAVLENILSTISINADIIVANDDTTVEVIKYEKDYNDIADFGLFVTKRVIPGVVPYRVSMPYYAYVNLRHVAFGNY